MAERCSAIRGESLGLDKSHRDSWRHPHDPGIVVSRKFAAVIALMQMGISDFHLIAEAVDLGVDEVKRIDIGRGSRRAFPGSGRNSQR